jgi:tetratricopeptide (TPR) repeat protein
MRRHRLSLIAGLLAASFPLVAARARPPAASAVQSTGKTAAGTTPAPPPTTPPPPGKLSPEAALARATAFYEAGQYVECSDAFAGVLEDAKQAALLAPRSREHASVYRAACLIAQSKTTEADDVFRKAIRENPQMAVPNVIVFPPTVIEHFIVVRTTLLEEIRRAEEERAFREREAAYQARRRAEAERERVARLEKLASEETLIVKNRRWLASVPFGIGQFQNRDYFLGSVFLASEVLLAGAAITATSIELSLNSQAKGGKPNLAPNEVRQLNANLRTANDVALFSAAAFLVVSAGGILEANLSFVPEFNDGVRERRKANPARDSAFRLAPVFGPTEGGAELGVYGRF